jgi:DNA-binding beta-propeller fold protein YncE
MRYLPCFLVAASAFAQGIITTVAGTDYIFPDSGKPAIQARIAGPNAMTFDKQGNLFFAVPDLNMVMKLDTKGVVSVVAGNGLTRFAGDGGPAIAASLNAPWGVGFDTAGNLHIADTRNARIRKVDAKGVITTVAGGGPTYPGDGLPATQAAIRSPDGVAFDPAGNMLIVEFLGRLRKVDLNGILTTIAGNGTEVFSGDGGPASSATLNIPEGLAVAPDGAIYIADHNNSCVRKISPAGIISTVAGRGTILTAPAFPPPPPGSAASQRWLWIRRATSTSPKITSRG